MSFKVTEKFGTASNDTWRAWIKVCMCTESRHFEHTL